jgi:bla regulator protein blaR1
MSVLLDMLIPACALSVIAAAALVLLPKAPLSVRLALALAGLAAWLVPWPWIRVPFTLPAALDARLAPLAAAVAATHPAADAGSPVSGLVWLLVASLAVGVLWFVADCATLRASLAAWRSRSSSGEQLRAFLPAELRQTRAAIRVVAGSRVAAVAGCVRPTIWIGDGFKEAADIRVALVHECWHARRNDPLLIAAVMLVKRAYWWNPIVAYLAARALLLVEAACDRRCAASLGASHYIERLAAMMLDSGGKSPRLAPAVRGHDNVLRLELLSAPTRWRACDCALLAALCAIGACIAGWSVAQARPLTDVAQPAWSRVQIPSTPAGRALTALLDLDAWSSGVELIYIVSSEPLRIEYVVENRVDETRRRGLLEVADGPGLRVTASAIRDLEETP